MVTAPRMPLMVLKTLDLLGPQHVFSIARRIEQISGDPRAISQTTLYPLLTKLEHDGAVATAWGSSEDNRRARIYRLTQNGRKQLQAETRNWERTTEIVGRFFAIRAEDIA